MKLKKSTLNEVEAAAASGNQQQGAYIASRFRNPAEEGPVKSGSDKAGLICAILATLILAAITALLYLNWDLIKTA